MIENEIAVNNNINAAYNVKKIRILQVQFDTEIKGYEIPAFRGAIIDKVGRENFLFHNHLNDTKYLYSYPKIQYKQINRRPTILCIDDGVDEIHKFFEKKDWELNISGRWLNMKIADLRMNQFTMQVWDKTWKYQITNWVALNQENYKLYQNLQALTEKVEMLQKLLTGNLLSFAKGIDWTVDKPVELQISDLKNIRTTTLKQQKVLAFDIDFSTNIFIPNYIGLGKSVSLGFGVVKAVKNEKY